MTTSMTDAAAKNAQTIQAFADGQNNIDRSAIAAFLTEDATFFPGARGASFEGREAFLDALLGWLNNHENGRFEILSEIYTDDEAFNEWRFVAKTKDGADVDTHGVDYFKLRDGKILVKSSFRKV
ncbi:nuclear transport factor 2 family protein [Gordonia sp. CPCC 205515]|uniref:nuclear transport factor 2 family protein n=1 Tax=Gordonia sp. CPCC 205515 TaxID=3140791 RepID=UPI003AF3F21C